VALTTLHLCFLPWALGTMHVWSQLTSLGLAAAGFALATWPRTGSGHRPDQEGEPSRIWPAAQLWRQPVVWAGLLFLGYITVQGMNPAWRFQSNADVWWLERLDPVAWLPTGVDAPFDRSNPWRALTIFGSLFLLVASVWTGLTRRRSYHALFVLLAANSVLLALLGLAQRLTRATDIFWSYRPSNASFVASFIYPNHAGSYLNLTLALTIGLAWWHHQRARRRLENPGRAPAFAAGAALIAGLVILSYSRMSIVLLLTLIRGISRPDRVRRRRSFRAAGLACAACFALALTVMQLERVRQRFDEVFAPSGASVRARTLAREAATDMLKDYWLIGLGAGCFQYGYPKYTANYPEIDYLENGARRSWEHAHNDILEFPIELGVIGLLPLLVVLGRGLWQFARRRGWDNVLSFAVALGCTLTLLHGWVDFVFQCPAVLLTWGVLSTGALRWSELDRPSPQTACTPAPGASSPA